MFRLMITVAIAAALTACAPTANVTGVRVSALSLTGATLEFDVKVSNPSPLPLPLVNAEFALASGTHSFLSGNAPLQGNVPAPPVITVKDVHWRTPTISSLRGTVTLGVVNPNAFAVGVRDFDYRVNLGQMPIVTGRAADPLNLAPEGEGAINLDVDFALNQFGSALGNILASPTNAFSASGSLRLTSAYGDLELPFASP